MKKWMKLIEAMEDDDPEGIDPELRDVISQHVDLTSEFMAKAKAMGSFTPGYLARVAMAKGISSQEALMRANMFLDHFPFLFHPTVDGSYVYEPEAKQDAMSFLKDIAARATRNHQIDKEVDDGLDEKLG